MANDPYTENDARVIPFAPDYSIMPDGVVTRIVETKNGRAGHVLRPNKCGMGYMRFTLCGPDGKSRHWWQHRLIALVFLGDPPKDKPYVCHNNGDRTDNRLENLRWDNNAGNQADRVAHGTSNRGERCAKAKLNEQQVREIRSHTKRRGLCVELGRKYGVHAATIAKIMRNETWL